MANGAIPAIPASFITYDLDVAADHIHAYIYDDADIGSGTTDDDTGTDSKSGYG